MNAPLDMEMLMNQTVGRFLQSASVEITPKQADRIPLLAAGLPKGAKVYIALIDPADVAAQLEAAIRLRAAGLVPVPHVPARFVRDRDDLARRLGDLAEKAKVDQMLVLGGGAPHP